jgi:hypothetical protein
MQISNTNAASEPESGYGIVEHLYNVMLGLPFDN